MRLLAVIVLFTFYACSPLREEWVPAYEMKSFAIESNPGCLTDTIPCAKFEVTYPHFKNLDTLAQSAITHRIAYWLSGGTPGELKSMEAIANDFIRDFTQIQRDVPEYGPGWEYAAQVSVLIASDSLISLQVDMESITGGAHGNYTTNFINLDPKTGTPYLLDTFLRPGYLPELIRLGELDFRKQRQLDFTASLEEAGFNFPANQFKLNDNYGFRKEGIVFFFNSYEIAAYVDGPTEILIPYEELGGWYLKTQ